MFECAPTTTLTQISEAIASVLITEGDPAPAWTRYLFCRWRGMTKHVSLISIATLLAGAWLVAAPHTAEPIASLWEEPTNLASRNLFTGPWGAEHAPDPHATFRLTALKSRGINPGVVVV